MDLKIEKQLFVVTGASDGLGFAVAKALLEDNADVIAVSRTRKRLGELEEKYSERLEIFHTDVTVAGFPDMLLNIIGERRLDGIFINAGGPPAGTFLEMRLADWDKAYLTLLRWKVELLQAVVPIFISQNYGRIILSESHSIIKPIKNLILSNSLRSAVAGLAKTLAKEVAANNITVNVLGPGVHDTHAMQRLFENRMKSEGISLEEARARYESEIPTGRMGTPEEFGKFAAYLLSPLSSNLTGNVFSMDGGATI